MRFVDVPAGPAPSPTPSAVEVADVFEDTLDPADAPTVTPAPPRQYTEGARPIERTRQVPAPKERSTLSRALRRLWFAVRWHAAATLNARTRARQIRRASTRPVPEVEAASEPVWVVYEAAAC